MNTITGRIAGMYDSYLIQISVSLPNLNIHLTHILRGWCLQEERHTPGDPLYKVKYNLFLQYCLLLLGEN